VTDDDIIVPLESYWVDSKGMEKLQLEVETIDLATASLILERALIIIPTDHAEGVA
jgi:hypothetical protein